MASGGGMTESRMPIAPQDQQLMRLTRNGPLDRWRLENDGYTYFGLQPVCPCLPHRYGGWMEVWMRCFSCGMHPCPCPRASTGCRVYLLMAPGGIKEGAWQRLAGTMLTLGGACQGAGWDARARAPITGGLNALTSPPPLLARTMPLSEHEMLFPQLVEPWNSALPFSSCL